MTTRATRNALRIRITAHAMVTCLGRGADVHAQAMREGRSGLAPSRFPDLPFDCYLGAVAGLDEIAFPETVADFDNRSNRLALAALATDGFAAKIDAVRARWGAGRCGIVMGTSTSGVEKLEGVYRARAADEPLPSGYSMRHHDNLQAVAAFLQAHLGLTGPSYTVSTACSSSAKALVDAVQLIEAGFCDAVITGGIDCLCLTSLNGFEALQLISREPCRPCDSERDGLSIGEAAALMIVERDAEGGIELSGWGESSDGVNMSTPPEDGAGAVAAMREALENAGLAPAQIGHVNLHGTATAVNDAAETRAVAAVLGGEVPVSSLKGAIGHTLGAAGAAEAVMCLIALEQGIIPGNTGLRTLDPAIDCNVSATSAAGDLAHVLSNSFGFGGNNCALVFSR
ncbi:beta-ketoacyl-ACP synthase [Rhodobacteraceae bacterium NNCM2]|nr:beta-ketoacyl-ACP synthase [Coraliihabitans acroporae]